MTDHAAGRSGSLPPPPPGFSVRSPAWSAPPRPAPTGYRGPGTLPAGWPPAPERRPTPRTWVLLVVAVAAVSALVGGLVGGAVGSRSQQTIVEKFFPNRSAPRPPADIQAVLAKVEPALVAIETQGTVRDHAAVNGVGTGMIITPDGEVLTNDHVVADATSVTVTLFGQSDARTARVVGTDAAQDLALLQIEGVHGLPTVQLGDSDAAQVGDTVLAIGNALGLSGGLSVTEGIVSSTDRSLTAVSDLTGRSENLTGLLQTDAAINSGNSGGPLVNSSGRVIGMNTAVAQSTQGNAPAQNIGFAIAIDTIKPLLVVLRSGGT